MKDFFIISLDQKKEIFTFKSGNVYHGAVNAGDNIFVTATTYDNALKAGNAARKLKKSQNIEIKTSNTTKTKKSENVKIRSKIEPKIQVFTEAETKLMLDRGLQMQEVWLIQDKKSGKFVASTLDQTIAEYDTDKNKAQFFKNFENAVSIMKILNSMIAPGHTLRRMYVTRHSVKCKEDKA